MECVGKKKREREREREFVLHHYIKLALDENELHTNVGINTEYGYM
jgi:hypothetical protein